MPKKKSPPNKREQTLIKNFGKKVQQIRLSKGLTLEDCEERGFPSWRNLSDIENGQNCTLLTITRISKCLNTPISKFFEN